LFEKLTGPEQRIFDLLALGLVLFYAYSAVISHAGDTLPDLCTSIFYKSDGVFGIMANVLATYITLFVIFGAFLEASGAQRFFIDFPLAAVGHRIGGPAKVSVIASGLFGSISGSAIANTVSTGAFTIPMMKVYWLSQDSNITPPVCIAAFAGAAIAKDNMWRTAFSAFKFAKFLYLGPFLFGYVPAFPLNGTTTDIVVAFALILAGTWAYSWLLNGIWLIWLNRK